ncbi:hypothetical protein SKAU_G00286470 [Synaphobranchus kaupii]|uniref:Synaptotagmin-3 n=1 Tax=Synaphobranchus kaupii TaxID=118154 RepID=A0A9Q1IP83_SYNKA|nr:hypothetical protein SKAU_G00286470 [Synaphobranchus kaupii]
MSGDWDEDLCNKALVLAEELCFRSPGGYSQNERCQELSDILRGRHRQIDTEISVSLLSVIVTFCGIVLLSVSLFVSWKLCWLPWRDKEGGGLSLTSGLLPGGGGLGGGSSLLPPLLQRKETHSSSSLYPSLSQPAQHHPHFSDMLVVERGEGGVGGVIGGPERGPHWRSSGGSAGDAGALVPGYGLPLQLGRGGFEAEPDLSRVAPGVRVWLHLPSSQRPP